MPRYMLTIKDRGEGAAALPPCQSATIGKLDFRRYTSVPSKRDGIPDSIYQGAVGEYKAADVAAFREVVKHFVVRWAYREKRDGGRELYAAQVYDTRLKDWFSVPELEEPLAAYLDVQEIQVDLPLPVIASTTLPELAAAKRDAEVSEERARATDPTDAARRRTHGRAKAAGESLAE